MMNVFEQKWNNYFSTAKFINKQIMNSRLLKYIYVIKKKNTNCVSSNKLPASFVKWLNAIYKNWDIITYYKPGIFGY